MSGETDLAVLLKTLKPELNEGLYSFYCVDSLTLTEIALDEVLMSFREKEGVSVIVSQQTAIKHNLIKGKLFSWITLSVHSSLTAVGLTAAFSTALAKVNISCNVIAGYYHDHIFVACEDTERAMQELRSVCPSVSRK